MPPLTADAIQWPSEALSRNQLLEVPSYARLTRDLEERLAILYRQNKIVGGRYHSLGQEGESVAAAYALNRRDAVAPHAFMPGVDRVVDAVRALVRY